MMGENKNHRPQRDKKKYNWPLILTLVFCIVAAISVSVLAGKKIHQLASPFLEQRKQMIRESEQELIEKKESEQAKKESERAELEEKTIEDALSHAEKMIQQYDYDNAIKVLQKCKNPQDERVITKISEIEETKKTLVEQNVEEITHIFFHILVEDPSRTFLDTKQGRGYNSVMTTVKEFNEILEQMYERGYVLVGLHDIAKIEKNADGTETMVTNQIMLPPGKKAFVMSQDDVCYYEYMEGSGCADRIVFDENGELTMQYTNADGSVVYGDYDLIPILNAFVEKHPDFSYRGAKAIIALTGYNGIFGYRTDETYDPNSPMYDNTKEANPNIEQDRETCKKIAAKLREDGFELASHSWGHRDYTPPEINADGISYENFKEDADRWEKNVEPLLGEECDILLYPFGADIGTWKPYTDAAAGSDTERRFSYLKDLGFRYFCNVDARQYWVQVGKDYFRQGRRNIDGYRLWMSYSGQASAKTDVSDLIDVATVFDLRRPTPIDWE